jgi:hypothetical protein
MKLRKAIRIHVKLYGALSCILLSAAAYAQPYNVRIPTHHYNNFNNNFPRHYGNSTYKIPPTLVEKYSKHHLYTIHFIDSTTREIKAKVDEYKGKYFLAIENATESSAVQPKETQFITLKNERGDWLKGIPGDSSWIFKIPVGDINLYSLLPEDNPEFVINIQQGDGPVLPFNAANLSLMLDTADALQELIKRGEKDKALRQYVKRFTHEEEKKRKR